MRLQNIFLVSDLGGILISANHTIPQRNIDAIWRFQEQDGRLAVATGRSVNSGERYCRQVQLRGFCIILNGPILYGYGQDEIVKAFFLPPQARDYARLLIERFPEIDCKVFTQRRQLALRVNQYVRAYLGDKSLPCVEIDAGETTDHWCKALRAADPETRLKIQVFTESSAYPGIRFVQSEKCSLEMLSKGADKGNGLLEILRQIGLPRENLVMIGDYYNGVEMLYVAGFAAVPSNASQGIRQVVDPIIGDCRGGTVADLIEYLERVE